jgi:apolipoprotein N-acyltransferase
MVERTGPKGARAGRAGDRRRRRPGRPKGTVSRAPYPAGVPIRELRRREPRLPAREGDAVGQRGAVEVTSGGRAPHRLTTVVLAVLGGLVTETAFPGRSWWPAAVLGIALLVLALRRDSARWAALVGFAWGLAFFLPHLYWLHVSVGAVPWIALALVEAAFVAAFGAAWVWMRRAPTVRRRPFVGSAVVATAWVVLEQARSVWPFGGFPWGRLAFSQTEAPTLALASLGGAPLVSAVVAGAGALLAQSWPPARARPWQTAGSLASAGALLAVGLLVPLPATDGAGDGETLRVAAVQGNVAEPGLDAFAHRLEVLRNHVEGTRAVAESSGRGELDVVLWPENAADVDPRTERSAATLVTRAATVAGAPLLVGTLRYDDRGRYNDSLLWTPQDGPVALYTKQHPAPFGEYIPMRDFARLFSDKVDLVRTDMLPGAEVGVIPLEVPRLGRTVPLAVAICFEVAYDGLVREAVLAGGEVIVVQTNNASFGWTQESVQQLAMTRLRAVEHGRTAVQVSTVGVSGIIGPDGTVLERTELFTADQMLAEVPLRSTITLADRLGDWPHWAAAAVAALALASGVATAGALGRARRAGSRVAVGR